MSDDERAILEFRIELERATPRLLELMGNVLKHCQQRDDGRTILSLVVGEIDGAQLAQALMGGKQDGETLAEHCSKDRAQMN